MEKIKKIRNVPTKIIVRTTIKKKRDSFLGLHFSENFRKKGDFFFFSIYQYIGKIAQINKNDRKQQQKSYKRKGTNVPQKSSIVKQTNKYIRVKCVFSGGKKNIFEQKIEEGVWENSKSMRMKHLSN